MCFTKPLFSNANTFENNGFDFDIITSYTSKIYLSETEL